MRKLAILLILILPLVVMPQSVFRGNSKISGSKIGAPSTPPSVVVSGAGTAAANGTYTYRGQSAGFPYYNLVGQPDSVTLSAIASDGDNFRLYGADGTDLYFDGIESSPIAFPWLSPAWVEFEGDSPAPTVTQGS